jgi:pyruvate-ferredoxin/flavodoxin oxidoreductase
MKRAVQSGYWPLYRFNPKAKDEHPLKIDAKAPTIPYKEFLEGEVRYSALEVSFPENADELFAKAEDIAERDYNELLRLAEK